MTMTMTITLAEILEQKEFAFINKKAQQISVPANHTIFRQGDPCNNYLIVLEGSVKVFSRAANGREVLLYRESLAL